MLLVLTYSIKNRWISITCNSYNAREIIHHMLFEWEREKSLEGSHWNAKRIIERVNRYIAKCLQQCFENAPWKNVKRKATIEGLEFGSHELSMALPFRVINYKKELSWSNSLEGKRKHHRGVVGEVWLWDIFVDV